MLVHGCNDESGRLRSEVVVENEEVEKAQPLEMCGQKEISTATSVQCLKYCRKTIVSCRLNFLKLDRSTQKRCKVLITMCL
jgi:hypothetical protein